MDKQNTGAIPMPDAPKRTSFFNADAKRMSFGTQDNMYDYKSSPPLSSFLGARGVFKPEGDPLTAMAAATRRDSLKNMAVFSDFSTD